MTAAALEEGELPESARPSAGRPDKEDPTPSGSRQTGESSSNGRATLSVGTTQGRDDDDGECGGRLSSLWYDALSSSAIC